MAKEVMADLEIEGPAAVCGHCRFTGALAGTFTVEDGLLVWRGEPDVLPGRGPGLESCCESYEIAQFTRIDADGVIIDGDELAALRESARAAAEAEMREWHWQEKPDDGPRVNLDDLGGE